MLGRSISHYRVLEKLGEGGMGTVYLAEDTLLGRRVAIKFPNSNPDFNDRLLAEARTASSLNHPAIAAVYDCGLDEGHPYVVMELVEGENLSERLKRGPLAPYRALEIARDTAAALAEAHRHSIVHRDIKPANIRIDPRGNVKVLDFGVAHNLAEAASATAASASVAETRTSERTFAGTPRYMSPEQARSEPVDARSDLFSLGAVLWECLTGQPAFAAGTQVDVLARVLHDDLPPPSTVNPDVPPVLDSICLKALAKDPAQRYQSAEALLCDLEAARHAPARKAPAPRANRLRLVVLAASLVTALIVAGVLWLSRSRGPDPQALRWYQEGANAIHDGTYFKAAKALERAVALDPAFALAHARLADASDELDDATRSRQEMLEAVAPSGFRSRLSSLDDTLVEAIRRSLANDRAGAAKLYRQILSRVPENEKAAAWLDLGRAHEKAGQAKDALSCYREAAMRSPQYAAAFLRLGVLDRRAQRFADAEANFAHAESLYQSLSNTEGLIAVLYQRGVMANRRGEIPQAGALLEKALEMARSAGSQQQQIETLLQISNVKVQAGDTTGAARQAADAVELARRTGLQILTAGGLLDLGNTHFARGDLAQAQSYFDQALESARRFHSARTEARALLSLGSLHIQQADFARGVPEVEQALRFYDQGGDANSRAMGLVLLGRARRDQGDYEGALKAFQEQLELANKTGDRAQLTIAREGVASVLEYQERYPEALAAYRQAYADSQARGDQVGALYALANSAHVLVWLGRYKEARETLAQAARPGGSPEIARTVEEYQAEMALGERRFAAARAGARRVLAAPGELDAAERIDAYVTACGAELLSGARREGLQDCGTALELARKSVPRLAPYALLSWSEAQLENGKSSDAKESALLAHAQFERSGQYESGARALLIAARASQAVQDVPAARSLASHAALSFTALCKSWPAEDRVTYESRPDVRRWRNQLAGILNE